ncbi:MAG: hypothetical protein Q4G46_01610 [Propionibacteriaceae bacterium]|nr:hypothetical protein [Propionibacteriaceae bacterium]
MPVSQLSQPRLLVDGAAVSTSLDMVPPELENALVAVPAESAIRGLVGRHGSGRDVAKRLDEAGITAGLARHELEQALDLAKAAYLTMSERARRRLNWPPIAERMKADCWLLLYSQFRARWLMDMAGGLPPTILLRCCLIARPRSLVELWMPAPATSSSEAPTEESGAAAESVEQR